MILRGLRDQTWCFEPQSLAAAAWSCSLDPPQPEGDAHSHHTSPTPASRSAGTFFWNLSSRYFSLEQSFEDFGTADVKPLKNRPCYSSEVIVLRQKCKSVYRSRFSPLYINEHQFNKLFQAYAGQNFGMIEIFNIFHGSLFCLPSAFI